MDLRRVRAFIAVAETSSVSKAAERLHISQPPLSRQIHLLEEELGVALFVRHHHGVTLTDAGRRLLDKARALDAAAAEFSVAAQEVTCGVASENSAPASPLASSTADAPASDGNTRSATIESPNSARQAARMAMDSGGWST